MKRYAVYIRDTESSDYGTFAGYVYAESEEEAEVLADQLEADLSNDAY